MKPSGEFTDMLNCKAGGVTAILFVAVPQAVYWNEVKCDGV
jgi:hypothetical protein